MALLAGLLGLSALALASAAVYGLMSYAVSRQTNEIGLRLALGSPRADVLRMVLGDALKVTAIGVAIAVPAAGWLGRFARTQLFEIGPLDPISLVGASVVMGLLSATAAFLPALKAARIDPVRALKTE